MNSLAPGWRVRACVCIGPYWQAEAEWCSGDAAADARGALAPPYFYTGQGATDEAARRDVLEKAGKDRHWRGLHEGPG